MAGIVADATDKKTKKSSKFVIGMQRPSQRSYWKIPYLNKGIAPVEAEDPEVAPLIARCVKDKKTLIATYTYDALKLADCVVVDVQCDYFKESLGNCRQGHAEIAALEDSLKIIGEKIKPDCLVLIETTVPPGTPNTSPIPFLKSFRTPLPLIGYRHVPRRTCSGWFRCVPRWRGAGVVPRAMSHQLCYEPLLAHSYERVMPGREYVASIPISGGSAAASMRPRAPAWPSFFPKC
jgi:hypothetical protein